MYDNKEEIDTRRLQIKIEEHINSIKESRIFKETPNLIKLLINKDDKDETAKLYLHNKLPKDIYDCTIVHFGVYTLEAIIIYVLGIAFSGIKETLMVRVATLIDLLDTTIRTQAFILNNKGLDTKVDEMKNQNNKKLLGKTLLEYMLKKKLVQIVNLSKDTTVVKETGKGYLKSQSYIVYVIST